MFQRFEPVFRNEAPIFCKYHNYIPIYLTLIFNVLICFAGNVTSGNIVETKILGFFFSMPFYDFEFLFWGARNCVYFAAINVPL
jgi:hypothetical protein